MSDVTNIRTATTSAFAASTDPRIGSAVSVERIIPVEYSPVTAITPRMPASSIVNWIGRTTAWMPRKSGTLMARAMRRALPIESAATIPLDHQVARSADSLIHTQSSARGGERRADPPGGTLPRHGDHPEDAGQQHRELDRQNDRLDAEEVRVVDGQGDEERDPDRERRDDPDRPPGRAKRGELDPLAAQRAGEGEPIRSRPGGGRRGRGGCRGHAIRSEEHTSELQSLMRISYAGFCLQK